MEARLLNSQGLPSIGAVPQATYLMGVRASGFLALSARSFQDFERCPRGPGGGHRIS